MCVSRTPGMQEIVQGLRALLIQVGTVRGGHLGICMNGISFVLRDWQGQQVSVNKDMKVTPLCTQACCGPQLYEGD